MERTVADLLRAGADKIEQHGLWRGLRKGESECVVTSMGKICEGMTNPALKCLGRYLNIRIVQIPAWNDSQQDPRVVINAMRDAAFAWEVENGTTCCEQDKYGEVPA